MTVPSILVVCTGNICRSPVGQATLRHLLREQFNVESAGTHAPVGRTGTAEAVEFVARELGDSLEHTARQLTREQAESADLIVTMTAEHRAWTARLAPRTVRRTFTLKELEVLLEALPSDASFTSLKNLAQATARLRPRLLADATDVDIADPYGGPAEGYETSFREILSSSGRVAHTILQRLPRT